MTQQEKQAMELFFSTLSKSMDLQEEGLRKLASVFPTPLTESILNFTLDIKNLVKEASRIIAGEEDLSHLYDAKNIHIQKDNKHEIVSIYTSKYKDVDFEFIYITNVDIETKIVEISTYEGGNTEVLYKKTLITDKSLDSALKFLESKRISHLNDRIRKAYR